MSNKGLLVVVVIILVGILAIMVSESSKDSPGEQFADSIGEIGEEISDEIDDATTE